MANDKPKLTQDLVLPPGSVVTPGYEVIESEARSGFSDRRLNADGTVQDLNAEVLHLSTYDANANTTTDTTATRKSTKATDVVEGAQG